MQKQKKGFWVFLCSLMPGAGEMYMGFKKQGLSIMILFFSLFSLASIVGMSWSIAFLPIVWFYSFFNVHSLKSMTEEEFYSVEDSYILHLDSLIGDADKLLSKNRQIIGIFLVVLGCSLLWSGITNAFWWFVPEVIRRLFNYVPQIVIAAAIIIAGFYILKNKQQKLMDEDHSEKEEHYWAPYRPYRQPDAPMPTQQTVNAAGTGANVANAAASQNISNPAPAAQAVQPASTAAPTAQDVSAAAPVVQNTAPVQTAEPLQTQAENVETAQAEQEAVQTDESVPYSA